MRTITFSIILFFVFLFLPGKLIYAQQYHFEKSTIDYWKTVYEYDANNAKSNGQTKNFSTKQINSLAKKYYDAISDDPVGFQKYFLNEIIKWKDSLKNGYPVQLKNPADLSENIKNIIAKKYGENFVQIIGAPYYLKVKILKDSATVYSTPKDTSMHPAMGVLIGIVEDVIKGEKSFRIGQQIKIYYLVSWLMKNDALNVDPAGDEQFYFKRSYFIPVKVWDMYDNFAKLALNCYNGAYVPIYPVEIDTIYTPDNYFGSGKTLKWEAFKKIFEQKYILK